MLIVLSPAKTLDYETPLPELVTSKPEFIKDSAELIEILKELEPSEIAQMMSLSDKLVHLNVARYANWTPKFSSQNSRASIFAFNGDVYEGLDAYSLKPESIAFAQQHLRILSGLYGLLKPLDLMQPYRLEMGTTLQNARGKDLYAFWQSKITKKLQNELKEHANPILLNLASDEYFKAVQVKDLGYEVIAPVFQDEKDGRMKIISFYAKRARGLMARFVIEKGIDDPAKLKRFKSEGYAYVEALSTPEKPVFQRKHSA